MTTATEAESALLARCSLVAREAVPSAEDQREANVFRLAAMVARSRFPSQSARLMRASVRYFALHPNDRMDSVAVVRQGWVASLPRLRDMLSHQLNGHLSGLVMLKLNLRDAVASARGVERKRA